MIRFIDVEIGYSKSLIKVNDLNLETGKVYALIGSNGSGKTTLLNTIIGKTKLLNGTILIDEKNIKEFKNIDLAKKIAFVEAKTEGVDYLKVIEYISLGRTPYTDVLGRLKADDHVHIDNSISTMGLDNFKEKFINELSDGEKQLTAIARAIAQDTSIIILDEPTAFLDYGNRKKMIQILSEISKKLNKCILFSTHDIDLCIEEILPIVIINQQSKVLKHYSTLSKNEILKIGFAY